MALLEDYIKKVVCTLNICSPETITRTPLMGFPQNLDTDESSDQLFLAYAGILLFHNLDNLRLLLHTEESIEIQQFLSHWRYDMVAYVSETLFKWNMEPLLLNETSFSLPAEALLSPVDWSSVRKELAQFVSVFLQGILHRGLDRTMGT